MQFCGSVGILSNHLGNFIQTLKMGELTLWQVKKTLYGIRHRKKNEKNIRILLNI
jgi:hypothetical protein